MGNRASKFASQHLQSLFHMFVVDSLGDDNHETMHDLHAKFKDLSASEAWQLAYSLQLEKKYLAGQNIQEIVYNGHNMETDSNEYVWRVHHVAAAVRQAFVQTDKYFQDNRNMYPNDVNTGTTATVVLLFPSIIFVANVGDSRAIICCDQSASTGDLISVALTEDHTPYNPVERERIETLGGVIINTGEKLRVNGSLAITRSLGDVPFGALLSPEPDITVIRRFNSVTSFSDVQVQTFPRSSTDSSSVNPCEKLLELQGLSIMDPVQQFIVLASDGLFDVMTNNEVVYFICDVLCEVMEGLIEHDVVTDSAHVLNRLPLDVFHIASEKLAQEAYVRGSSDNIGVCIISLL